MSERRLTRPDPALVERLARAVGEELAAAEVARDSSSRSRLAADDRHQLTLRLLAGQLDALASERLADGHDLLGLHEEEALRASVLALVEGLGRHPALPRRSRRVRRSHPRL